MEYLEELSQRLENLTFDNTNAIPTFPCPPSVLKYLNQDAANMERNNENASSDEQSNNQTKKEQEKEEKQKFKMLNSTENQFAGLKNWKNFYSNYMPLDDVKKGLKSGKLFEGKIHINPKCYSEAFVPSPDKTKDILLNGIKSRNRALDGDTVVVKLLNKSKWMKSRAADCLRTGEVVYISEKKDTRIVVGNLIFEKGLKHPFCSMLPRGNRFPKIIVNTSTWPRPIRLKNGTQESKELFYAVLSDWDNYRYPMGILKGVLGKSGEINAETESLLITLDIKKNPYPEDINQYFPPLFCLDEELQCRKDFRKHCIFSIDPPTAKDLDDALSCILLSNGNFEIGIHISDVAYFVKHGTPLDKIAEETSTSVHLVQEVYHMLPPTLMMLASLQPGVDKLAISIILEMTPDANIVNHSFCQSIICSCAQLHFAHAQIFLENPERKSWNDSEFPTVYNGFTIKDCATSVCYLHKLATIMRKRRFNNGALANKNPKLSFEIDKVTCEPLSYSLYILHESNWLIEEFMLLANVLVAEHLKTHCPTTAMLRNHQPPDSTPMEKAVKMLKAYGINIDNTSAGSIHKSRALCCEVNPSNNHWEIIINNILSTPIGCAEYCVIDPGKNLKHYALNVPYYTHFTSPISSYPDLIVHRMLISWLTGISIKEYENPDVIDKIAKNSNDKKKNAKKASEKNAKMYAVYLIGKLGGLETYACIMTIKKYYFEAIVLSMNIYVRVNVNTSQRDIDMEHKACHYTIENEKPTLTIVWDFEKGIKQKLHIFDKVKLKLKKKYSCLKLKSILIRDH